MRPFMSVVGLLLVHCTLATSASRKTLSERMEPRFAVLRPTDIESQAQVQVLLDKLKNGEVPPSAAGLESYFIALLRAAGNLRSDKAIQIEGMIRYLGAEPAFARRVLPFLASVASRLDVLFPNGLRHITRANPQSHLRRIQVLALLAAAFFGIIPHNQRELLKHHGYLRLNRLDMFYRGFFVREPKFMALLTYFYLMQHTLGGCWEQMEQKNDFSRAACTSTCICQQVTFQGRTVNISPADEIISFYLHTPEVTVFESPQGHQKTRPSVDVEKIVKSHMPLSNAVVDVDGDITKCDGELQVDFADRYVGGLSMWAGHVAQEELFFATRPELNAVMLMLDALKDDEALVVKGYESTFRIKPLDDIPSGSHWSAHGYTPLDSMGRRETTVVAIDALIVRDEDEQYGALQMMREVLKATLGFQGDPFELPVNGKLAAVATGKWGCVIFGGDNELKTLLQWMAATVAQRDFHYQAFRDHSLLDMHNTLLQIRKRFPTIKSLYEAIVQCVKQRPRGAHRWSLWKALLAI